MSSISQVSEAMQTILSTRATALERSTGFVQRASVQLDGALFAQTCVSSLTRMSCAVMRTRLPSRRTAPSMM